jgi:hypothetical protein
MARHPTHESNHEQPADEPAHEPHDPKGSSPPRQEPQSPSRTAPEPERKSAQQEAIELGRDPPIKPELQATGGVPNGSPGRPLEHDPHDHDPGTTQGAHAPEPKHAKDHKPGQFEQPSRQEMRWPPQGQQPGMARR